MRSKKDKRAVKATILVAIIFTLGIFFLVATTVAATSYWTQTSKQDFEQAIFKDHVDLATQPGAIRLSSSQFLITNSAVKSIQAVGRSGEIAWEYNTGLSSPSDGIRLASGNTLITDSGNHRVFEISPAKTILWQYGTTGSRGSGPNQLYWPMDATRTDAGTTLIADTSNHRVIEVDSAGTIIWQYGTTEVPGGSADQLDRPYDAIRLDNGNTLIADFGNHRVLEVTSAKTIAWQYGITGSRGSGPNQLYYPVDGVRLANDNTLIADTYNHRVIEVKPPDPGDPPGTPSTIVWQYGTTGVPGSGENRLEAPFDAVKLTNGNILIADGGNSRALEVDIGGNIVWEYKTSNIRDIKELLEPQYILSGSLLSSVFDAESYSSWNIISWSKTTPSDTNIAIKTRTSDDYKSWSSWSANYTNSSGQSITSPPGRFIQYKATLNTSDSSTSPTLYDITISYQPDTEAPEVPTNLTATPGTSPDINLSWLEASDNLRMDHYVLYRSLSPITSANKNQANIISYRIPKGTTTYTDSSGIPGQTYYYAASAVDKAGNEGALSDSPSATVAGGQPPKAPHGSYLQEPEDCALCHLTHTGVAERQLTEQTEVMVCYTCHDSSGSGSIYTTEIDFAKTYHHKIPEGTQTCSSCHDTHGDKDPNNKYYARLLQAADPDGDRRYQGNKFCGACHGAEDSLPGGDMVTPFTGSAHGSYPTVPESGTEIMCARCHASHGSDYASLATGNEEELCYNCHSDNNNQYHYNESSIRDQFTASSNSITVTKKAGADRPPVVLNTHHDMDDLDQLLSGSKLECKNCHSIHETKQKWTGTESPVINPDTGLTYASTTIHPAWKIAVPDYNTFCETCHDSGMPPGVQNTNLTDVKLYYEDPGSNGNYHGAQAGTGYQGNLRAPYTRGMGALPCTDCHDWHGTSNLFHIKESIQINEDQAGNVGDINLVPVSINSGEDLAQLCVACHKDYGTSDVGNGWKGVPTADSAGNCLTCHQHELPGWF